VRISRGEQPTFHVAKLRMLKGDLHKGFAYSLPSMRLVDIHIANPAKADAIRHDSQVGDLFIPKIGTEHGVRSSPTALYEIKRAPLVPVGLRQPGMHTLKIDQRPIVADHVFATSPLHERYFRTMLTASILSRPPDGNVGRPGETLKRNSTSFEPFIYVAASRSGNVRV
jgi:hypothetical protein